MMKRKLYSVLLTLALSLAVVFGLAACTGKYKMKDFVADFSDFKKTYEVGDEIDLSKVKIYATFSDDSKENIPFEKVTITIDGTQVTLDNINKATESVGEKVIEIKYSNIVRSVTIKVVEK
ncbi:MAG: bacterial Ig-like domain-containing protein, partial [Gammaproteobacteria bacterium]|nr:bacterial Ig-like domain-containing protein [Gammaproteobacteria bacterium]